MKITINLTSLLLDISKFYTRYLLFTGYTKTQKIPKKNILHIIEKFEYNSKKYLPPKKLIHRPNIMCSFGLFIYKVSFVLVFGGVQNYLVSFKADESKNKRGLLDIYKMSQRCCTGWSTFCCLFVGSLSLNIHQRCDATLS